MRSPLSGRAPLRLPKGEDLTSGCGVQRQTSRPRPPCLPPSRSRKAPGPIVSGPGRPHAAYRRKPGSSRDRPVSNRPPGHPRSLRADLPRSKTCRPRESKGKVQPMAPRGSLGTSGETVNLNTGDLEGSLAETAPEGESSQPAFGIRYPEQVTAPLSGGQLGQFIEGLSGDPAFDVTEPAAGEIRYSRSFRGGSAGRSPRPTRQTSIQALSGQDPGTAPCDGSHGSGGPYRPPGNHHRREACSAAQRAKQERNGEAGNRTSGCLCGCYRARH